MTKFWGENVQELRDVICRRSLPDKSEVSSAPKHLAK